MLSKGALNPADITVLFKMFSSMDPPPVELVRAERRGHRRVCGIGRLRSADRFYPPSDQSSRLPGSVHAVAV